MEMEKLLDVARREHAKAVVDIQQLTRQLTRDKERTMVAAEINRQGLQQELAAARKKLQAVQMERNLMLVSTLGAWQGEECSCASRVCE